MNLPCADVVDAALGVKNLDELRLDIFDRHSRLLGSVRIKIDAQERQNERKQMLPILGGSSKPLLKGKITIHLL
jgi:hypothetical protein